MTHNIIRIWRPIATVIILVFTIAAFTYYFVSHPMVRQQLYQTSLLTLLILFGLYILVIVALCMVTLLTLRLCNIKLAAAESTLLTMYATVINFFGPLQSGPAFRGVYLKRKHGLNLKKYTAATLIFYMLYALFSGLFLLSGILGWWLLVVGAFGVASLTYIGRSKLPLAKRFQALNLDALYALAAATLFQLSIVAVIYFVELRSIQHGVTFGQAVIYAGAANFSLFVSLTPGAIGFRESFLLFSQRFHHISSSTIVTANIIDRSMYIVLLAVVGLIILVTHTGRRLRAQ